MNGHCLELKTLIKGLNRIIQPSVTPVALPVPYFPILSQVPWVMPKSLRSSKGSTLGNSSTKCLLVHHKHNHSNIKDTKFLGYKRTYLTFKRKGTSNIQWIQEFLKNYQTDGNIRQLKERHSPLFFIIKKSYRQVKPMISGFDFNCT